MTYALTRDQVEAFVQAWISAWNRGDVESVAAHYAEDAVFTSPRAEALTGHPVVRGRQALLAYWTLGRAKVGRFDFRLLDWSWDNEKQVLTLRYLSRRGAAEPIRAVEIMRFAGMNSIVEGEALYGAQARIS
jgi:hypothetical protein